MAMQQKLKFPLILGVSGLAVAGLMGMAMALNAPQQSSLPNPEPVAPASMQDVRENEPLEIEEEKQPVIETKTETKTSAIPHKTVYKNDATMVEGTSKTTVTGYDGEETKYYLVTYTDGVETARELQNTVVTKEAVDTVIVKGTKKATTTTTTKKTTTSSSSSSAKKTTSTSTSTTKKTSTSSTTGGTYVNSKGNVVSSPTKTNNGGATARCKDGTYSYSQSRRGTCSHHGGVAKWL